MKKLSNPTRVAEAALAIIFAPKTNPDKKSNWKWRRELEINKTEPNLMEYYDSQTVISYELYGLSVGIKKLESEGHKSYNGIIELIQENVFLKTGEFLNPSEEKVNEENRSRLANYSHLIKRAEFASDPFSSCFKDSVRIETFRLTPTQKENVVIWKK